MDFRSPDRDADPNQKLEWRSLSGTDWVALALGTGLFIGMIPPRTATIATTLGIPLAIALKGLVGWTLYLPVLVVLWLAGIPIAERCGRILGLKDPREVTYDEFTTLPLVYFLAPHFSWQVLAAGFALHRLFDITKPLGIRRAERLGGGLGIMLDDVLASVYALGCMHILYAAGWLR